MSDTLTRCQIINAYRLFFEREPESEAVIESYLTQDWNLWQFLKILADSPEGQRCQMDKGARLFIDHEVRPIAVDAGPEALARLVAETKTTWSALGKTDPFWSVLTDDEYRTTALDEARREAFYASGAAEFDVFTAACKRNGIAVDAGATLVELGCGTGRVGQHLAGFFARYIGVDISPAHLQIARERLSSQGMTNAQFLTLEDFLQRRPSFDIFYTILTLQHSPPPVMVMVLRAFLSRLRPRGYAFFQLPCHLYDYAFELADYGSRRAGDAMEMHALPQPHVFRALAENGLVPLEVVPYPRIGPIGFSFAFLAAKS